MDDEELQDLLDILSDKEDDDDTESGNSLDYETQDSAIENEINKQIKPPADSSRKPKGILRNAKINGKLFTKGAANLGKAIIKVMGTLATNPYFWIVVAIIVIVIIVVVILKDLANNTSSAIINNINDYVVQDDSLSEEQKAAYNEKASLLKFPLTSINTLYDRFIAADFTEDVVAGYTSIFGLKDVVPDGGTVEDNTDYEDLSEAQSGNTSWDSGGLEMMDFETTEGELVEFEVSFFADILDENNGIAAYGDTPLVFGVVASNAWELGTTILLEGHGVFLVAASGSSEFDNSTTIGLCVNRNEGESDEDYKDRVSGYGKQIIKGKIITGGLKEET